MKSIGICGLGKYLPDQVLSNQDIVDMGVDTSHDWIVERTGICERRIVSDTMTVSDMGVESAKIAIKDAGVQLEDIGLLVCATSTGDYSVFPSTACIMQEKLGLPQIPAFDISAACTGFNYAVTVAQQFLQTSSIKYGLVVASESLSRFVDWEDRSTCILFGDGAATCVLSESEEGYGILSSKLFSDGSVAQELKVESGGSSSPIDDKALKNRSNFISMNGQIVFKTAVSCIVPAVLKALESLDLTIDDIDYFVPHQANKRLINKVMSRLGLNDHQVLTNLHKYGNTSAASIPIVLAESSELGVFNDGDIIVSVGFGAGFTWGVTIFKWGKAK